VGGFLAVAGIVFLCSTLGWIQRRERGLAIASASAGFAAAALLAVNTLSSPIGPVASTAFVGAAGVWSLWQSRM
jgi:hypothetical protein